MKNIHLIPTDKPSRLYLHSDGELQLRTNIIRMAEDYFGSNQHIYITSDSDIKEGDLILPPSNIPVRYDGQKYKGDEPLKCWKKIILTTDQDLIKDGVQAINDEFLEWFVNNPNCEKVEVDLISVNEFGSEISVNGYGFTKFIYKIIIPKEEPIDMPKYIIGIDPCDEEPKTNLDRVPFPELVKELVEYYEKVPLVEEPKQETLEEAMNKNGYHDKESDDLWREGVEFGAKWQQEQDKNKYSEEDLKSAFHTDNRKWSNRFQDYIEVDFEQWFEQHKKK